MYHDYKLYCRNIQGKFATTPAYRIVAEEGPDHDKVLWPSSLLMKKFMVSVAAGQKSYEQEAARLAYDDW